MNPNLLIPRRTFLKGLGTAIALPMLDAMTPLKVLAKPGPGSPSPPVRLGVLFIPNGAHMPQWTPEREGADYDLPYILQPLEPVKSDLLVLSGLTHDKGRDNGDGPGDHARSAAVFLTGVQPLKSEGSEIRAGISLDQHAARQLGHLTRFPSLEIGAEPGRQAGKCDSGYSCAYSNNISWRDEATPMAKEMNPRLVFERLFANDQPREIGENQAKRLRYKQSILDFVLEDARQLTRRVGGQDQQKLAEYLAAVREIEQRIERAEQDHARQPMARPQDPAPAGIPESYADHLRLLCDMMVLAFQADLTRICTFMLANEGSNRSYRFISVNEGHHDLSHHQGDPQKQARIAEINKFHIRQFGYLLQRLKAIPEGDGSLLDHCQIIYGGGISDGNAHNRENLPFLLAGRGGGSILPGRHLRYPVETPACNLYLSLLDRMGIPADSFGDSTGRLPWLAA